MTPAELADFQAEISSKLQEEQMDMLGEQIDCFNLLSGQDEDKRA